MIRFIRRTLATLGALASLASPPLPAMSTYL